MHGLLSTSPRLSNNQSPARQGSVHWITSSPCGIPCKTVSVKHRLADNGLGMKRKLNGTNWAEPWPPTQYSWLNRARLLRFDPKDDVTLVYRYRHFQFQQEWFYHCTSVVTLSRSKQGTILFKLPWELNEYLTQDRFSLRYSDFVSRFVCASLRELILIKRSR